jgi:hypothetical protein
MLGFNLILHETEREDYRYSGSENEEEEPAIAGEPSSIVQAPGGDTLRRNFQQIQVHLSEHILQSEKFIVN